MICGNDLNWLLKLNPIYETLDWGKKWLADFNARCGLAALITLSIKVKMDGSEEKLFFEMLGLTIPSKLYWGSYIISIAKTVSKKIGASIRSMKLLSPEIALYLPCAHVWNTVVTCGLVPLVATWSFSTSYKNEYARLLVLHLLLLLNPWLIVEI